MVPFQDPFWTYSRDFARTGKRDANKIAILILLYRSLDEVKYEPQDEVDRKILEIEELRPKLSPAQNADLDKILYDELAKAGLFKLVDDEGNEVPLPPPPLSNCTSNRP